MDKTMKNILKIAPLMLVSYSGFFSNQLHININDPAYEYLDQISTQFIIPL